MELRTGIRQGLVGLLLTGGLMAAAQALPVLWVYGAYGYSTTDGRNVTYFTPGSLTHVESNAAFAAMANTNGPVAQAYVDTAGFMFTGQPSINSQASAAVQYDFYVSNGMSFSDLVPITVKGQAFFSGNGDALSSGYARLVHSPTAGGVNNGSFSNKLLSWGCGQGGTDCNQLIDFEWHLNISAFAAAEPGEIARVNLFAMAKIFGPAPYASQGGAWVDPIISIDASYLATHPNASLVVDPSVINAIGTAPVPEPGSAALLLAGLAVVGARLRRR